MIHTYEDLAQMMEEELESHNDVAGSQRSSIKDKNALAITSKKKAEMIKKNENKNEKETIAMKIRRNVNIKVA